ncbi:MAG: bifunctional 3-deoxy-7-phosphoheptulonate synthase/chorismate mutase type II [Bacteroidota bacterium]
MQVQSQIKQSKRPFLIAGPCSAESPEQLLLLANQLKQRNVSILRAGIWKPRTRPGSFEGLGEVALPWLMEASEESGLPVAIEVANADHVEKALKAGVDVLWIGARSTVNPFTVQEIADSLRGVRIPVMVKNPVNPDLNLWIGAFERLENAGINDLVAVHRGFSVYAHPKYRNVPSWEIPLALREKLPELPMLCDPSHIGGKRNLLLEIAQKGMDLNMDGLMVEVHPTPDFALSDAEQQITPDDFSLLISKLVLRSSNVSLSALAQLEQFRDKTSEMDDTIFDILKKRMQVSNELGRFKKENAITVFQQERWIKIISERMGKAADYDLSPIFVRQIMDAIHQESIRHQTRVMNDLLSNDPSID